MKKRVISILLVLTMVASWCGSFVLPANAVDSLPVYYAYENFGSNVFSYYSRNVSTGVNTQMSYNSSNQMYMIGSTANYIHAGWLSTGVDPAIGSLLVFTAPYTGTITISSDPIVGGITNRGRQWSSTYAECYATVYGVNWVVLANYALPANNTTVAFTDIEDIRVEAGQEIRFLVGSSAAMNSYVEWLPMISYTDMDGDIQSHEHSWAAEWSTDDTCHWHDCLVEDCDVSENAQKDGYGEHTDADADEACDTCGYEMPQAMDMPCYNLFNDFANSVFTYSTRNVTNGVNAEMNWNENQKMYQNGSTANYISSGWLSVGVEPAVCSVVTFTAPQTGKITITADSVVSGITNRGKQWSSDYAGCYAQIFYNSFANSIVSYNLPANNTPLVVDDITMDIAAGDRIMFMVGSNTAKNSYIEWIPEIAYTEVVDGPVHQHAWAEEWSADETFHWHECVAGCYITGNEGKKSYGEHVDENNDNKCDACGYKMSAGNAINMEELLAPVWEGTTVYNESVMVLKNADGSIDPISLIYPIDEIVAVYDSALKVSYEENVDYKVENGKLVVMPDGSIPMTDYDQYYLNNEVAGSSFAATQGGYIYFAEGKTFHQKQIAVTYKHTGTWQGEVPEKQAEKLPKTISKLENKEPLKIVYYGDSITVGANSSSYVGAAPNLPTWTEMVTSALKREYGYDDIVSVNKAQGGQGIVWGLQNINSLVAAENPDLVFIGFGMNDNTDNATYGSYIKSMISQVRQSNPNCEFILIGTMLPNAEVKGFFTNHDKYVLALDEIAKTNKGIAVADVTTVHNDLLKIKRYYDMTGNNVNHPNDFLARIYAQVIMQTLKADDMAPPEDTLPVYSAWSDFDSKVFSYVSRNVTNGVNTDMSFNATNNMYMIGSTGNYISSGFFSTGVQPAVCSMLVFTAPYTGTVTIASDPVVGGITNRGKQWSSVYEECYVQVFDNAWNQLARYDLPANNTTIPMAEITLNVIAGQQVRFLVGSNKTINSYIEWIPMITYTDRMDESHTHEWKTEWVFDEVYHWHECTDFCDITDNAEKDGYGEHTNVDEDQKCDVCGYDMPVVDLETAVVTLTAPANGAAETVVSDVIADWLENYSLESTTIDPNMGKGDNYYKGVEVAWKLPAAGATTTVIYATNANFADAKSVNATGVSSVVLNNLYTDMTYYWKVEAAYSNGTVTSDVFTFTTADTIRVVLMEGVSNTRDMGGQKISENTTIKQGLIYRGGNMNEMTAEGFEQAIQDLGIKTELDLRSAGEGGCGTFFPLGDSAAYVNVSTAITDNILKEENRANFAKAVKVFADEDNYPIYIHCQVGRDRTGTLAFVLMGLLGASQEQIMMSYEMSFFSQIAGVENETTYLQFKNNLKALYEKFENYSDGTFRENIEQYLLDIGVTANEIAAIRAIMLDAQSDGTGEHSHDWLYTWNSDDYHHWHECLGPCTIMDNTQKGGYGEHIDEDGDKLCDICGSKVRKVGVFNAADDIGSDVFGYYSRNVANGVQTQMSWNGTHSMYMVGSTGNYISAGFMSAGVDAAINSLLVFTAPYTGTITISADSVVAGITNRGKGWSSEYAVCYAQIYDNSWNAIANYSLPANNTTVIVDDVVLQVNAGDQIKFMVGSNTPMNSYIEWIPEITYTEVIGDMTHQHVWAEEWSTNEEYHWHECTAVLCDISNDSQKNGYGAHADEDGDEKCDSCNYDMSVVTGLASYFAFSDFGTDVFSYIARNVSTGYNSEMAFNSTQNMYQFGSTANYIHAGWMSTGVNSAIGSMLVFTAPYSGTITIASDPLVGGITNRGKQWSSTYAECYATVYGNDWTVLANYNLPANNTTVEFTNLTEIKITRGQQIKFLVGSNSEMNSYVEWLPMIVYTEIAEEPPHEHAWSTEWTSDKTGHWHECTDDCDIQINAQKDGYAAHVDENADEACDICGYVAPEEPTGDGTDLIYSFVGGYQTESADEGLWQYYVRDIFTNFHYPMTYNEATQRWESESTKGSAYIAQGELSTPAPVSSTEDYMTVIRFVAPYKGTVTLTFPEGLLVSASSTDGIAFNFWQNNISNQHNGLAAGIVPGQPLPVQSFTFDVIVGQKLNFLFHRNGSEAGDIVSINPTITYIEADVEDPADRWLDEKEPVEDSAFSFAFIPDTQNTVAYYPNLVEKIYSYILDNKESKNIQYVFGLGDITDGNTEAEWENAIAQFERLDGVIPYSAIRGNHDMTAEYVKYMGNGAYMSQFDGALNNSPLNTYKLMTINGVNFMMLNMNLFPIDSEIAWANNLIATHPDHNVIITTHGYLGNDGKPIASGTGFGKEYTDRADGNNGDELWDKLVSKHANILMVVSGHISSEDILVTQTEGVNGNVVTQVLADLSNFDAPTDKEGPMGAVVLMHFSEDGKTISVETYSTIREQYFKKKNQFEIPISLVVPGSITPEICEHKDNNLDRLCDECQLQMDIGGVSNGVYSAKDMFSNSQSGVWQYMKRYVVANTYQKLKWDGNMWVDGMGAMIAADWAHTSADANDKDEAQTCLQFVCPYDGTIKIGMENGKISVDTASDNGVRIAIWKNNDAIIGYTDIKGGDNLPIDGIRVNVKKGDIIRFLGTAISGNNANDSYYMVPIIKYTNIEYRLTADQGFYSALDMFSGEQTDIWRYMKRESVSNTYSELTWADWAWVDDFGGIISKEFMHASADASDKHEIQICLEFVAPSDGYIELGMEDDIITAGSDSTNGVRVAVMHNGNLIFGYKDIAAHGGSIRFERQKFNVTKGDTLRFLLMPIAGNNAGDSCTFLPWIKYLQYEKMPDPVIEDVEDDPSKTYYDCEADYGGFTNPWYYSYCQIGTLNMTPMSWALQGGGFYVPDLPGLQIGADYVHPYPGYQAVRVFRAPKSGTIRISMKDGRIRCATGTTGGEDGVYVAVRLNDGASVSDIFKKTLVLPGENMPFEEIEMKIYEGWELWFVLDCNANSANDSTRFIPIIEYLEITDEVAPVISNRDEQLVIPSLDDLNAGVSDKTQGTNKNNDINIWLIVAVFFTVAVLVNSVIILVTRSRKKDNS